MDTKKEVGLTIITILRRNRAILQYSVIPDHMKISVSITIPDTMTDPFP